MVVEGGLLFFKKLADATTSVIGRRLAHDPRMLAVWRQLQRRQRNSGKYLYRPRRDYLCKTDWTWATEPHEQVQGMALALLFWASIDSVRSSVITKSELEWKVENYSLMAARLRQDCELLDELGIAAGDELGAFDCLIRQMQGPCSADPRRDALVRRQPAPRQRRYQSLPRSARRQDA